MAPFCLTIFALFKIQHKLPPFHVILPELDPFPVYMYLTAFDSVLMAGFRFPQYC